MINKQYYSYVVKNDSILYIIFYFGIIIIMSLCCCMCTFYVFIVNAKFVRNVLNENVKLPRHTTYTVLLVPEYVYLN